MPSTILCLLLLGFVIFGTACSSYDQRWREAQAAPRSGDPFAGSYAGKWESSRYKSATGKLWCILTPQPGDIYLAEFRATWHGIFSSQHSVLLRVTDRVKARGTTVAKFAGAAEIKMWIGSGRYRCTGEMRPDGFVAEYDANADRGRFELKRVESSSPQP